MNFRFTNLFSSAFLLLSIFTSRSNAQIFCNSNGNVIIYSNYDGGYLNINVDQNIPNLKIGITTYEDCEVSITGTYASNVTQVIYAGYQGNNQHCNPSPATTSVNGVNANIVDILLYPPVTENNPDGYPYIICNYQCDSVGYQGGCNTADQISDFFLTQFGGSLYYHFTQYGCWSGTYKVSAGGDCCIGENINQQPLTPQSNLSVSDTSICQKFCTDFFDLSTNSPTSWLWTFEGGSPASSILKDPSQICYNDPGTYDITLISTNGYGSDTLTLQNFINVFATPSIPAISQNGNELTCSDAYNYQWQLNSVDIPGATNQTYTATVTGLYTVIIGNENGCKNAATLYVEISGIENTNNDDVLNINYNQQNQILTIQSNIKTASSYELTVFDLIGQVVFHFTKNTSVLEQQIDLSNLPASTYFVRMILNDKYYSTKILQTRIK